MKRNRSVQVERSNVGDVLVMNVSGEVDLVTSPALREQVLAALETPGQKVLVSLHGVTHLDSSGMATLVEALQKAKQSGGRLVLTDLDDHVRTLFRITHLDELFQIAATQDDGLRLLAAG